MSSAQITNGSHVNELHILLLRPNGHINVFEFSTNCYYYYY